MSKCDSSVCTLYIDHISRQDVKMWLQNSAHGTKIWQHTISWETTTKIWRGEWLIDTIWYYLESWQESTIVSSCILGTMLPHLYGYTISGDHCNPWHIYFVATYMQPKPLELPEMQGHFLILNFSNVTQNLGFGLWKECNEPKYTKFSKWNTRPWGEVQLSIHLVNAKHLAILSLWWLSLWYQ